MSNVDKGTARERIAERIRSGQLITRLENFALSKPSDKDYEDVQLNQTQVAAARIVLAKSLPDLKQVEQFIKDDRRKTKTEVDAALIANGIDPEKIWKQVTQH